MPREPFNEAGTQAGAGLILEVGLQAGEVPLRIPVTVQNFAAGLLTLKVAGSLPWVEWETLSGHDSLLRLPATGSGETGALAGKISWIKQSGPEGSAIFLGMETTQPASRVQKLLEDQVLHTPKDMQDLWRQWDRVQVKSRRSAVMGTVVLIIGVLLLVVGAVLSAAPHRFPEAYGYGSLAVGGLLTLVTGIKVWRQRRV